MITPEEVYAKQLVDNVAGEIAAGNYTQVQISDLILDLMQESGTIIVDTFQRPRVFEYSDPVAATDADCTTDFERTFAHADWVDGESLVQAEQTTFEDGFNFRFHRIEDDIDTLGGELAKAYACIAELRAQLATALTEIRTEINQINQDVFECCNEPSSRPEGIDMLTVPGIVGNWVGSTVVNDNEFLVYENLGRYSLIPKVDLPVAEFIPPPPPVVDLTARLDRVSSLARWTATNQGAQRWFAEHSQGFLVEDLLEQFGGTVIDPETKLTVEEAVVSLPPNSRFASADELIDRVMNFESAAVRGSKDVNQFLSTLEITDRRAVDTVSVSKLSAVTQEVSAALIRSGLKTVGSLANITPGELMTTLEQAGVQINAGDAAGILANANTVLRIGTGR
jgi:hypothetical protein